MTEAQHEMALAKASHPEAVTELLTVVAHLRDPERGCPWDLKQTHQSLRPYLLEEAYEAVEALTQGNPSAMAEELGDVLLQVVLHAQLAQEAGTFNFYSICAQLAEKLVRRHPHVFDAQNSAINSPEAVTTQWNEIKAREKAEQSKNGENGNATEVRPDSILKEIATGQPALSRAHKISQKAVKHGFAWPNFDSLWACVMSEYDEFRTEWDAVETSVPGGTEMAKQTAAQQDRLEDELGDILFATVSLAGHAGVDPEVALHRATEKFIRRFQGMEAQAPKPLKELSFEEWDSLWRQAKTQQYT